MNGNRTKLLVPLATMAVAAAVTVGSGATWTSSTGINSSVKAGSILTTNSRGGLTLDISRLEPGDTQTGSVQITHSGDMDAKLVLSQTSGTNGFALPSYVTLAITEGTTTIWSGDFASMSTSQDLDTSFVPNETHTYTFTVTLSASTPDDQQGKQANAAFAFISTPVSGQDPTNTWG
jgi:hypothetical protein